LLGEGLSIASELGIRPLMERVQALQEKANEAVERCEKVSIYLHAREVDMPT
jgi:hypothetical protein